MPITDREELKRKLTARLSAKDLAKLCELCAEQEGQMLLYELMMSSDDRVGDNAARVLNHVTRTNSEWISTRRDELTNAAIKTPREGLRRWLLTMLAREDYSPERFHSNFLNACFEWMMSEKESPSVRSLAMKLAYKQCHHTPELLDELHYLADQLDPTKLSSGMKCALREITSF